MMTKLQSWQQQCGLLLRWISRPAWLMVCGLSGILGCAAIAEAWQGTPCDKLTKTGFYSTVLGPTTFDQLHIVNAGDANVQIKTKGDVDV
jgi:hypothetical protein